MLKYGIGLTNLVQDEAGMNRDIKGLNQKDVLETRLHGILIKYRPARIAFNGKGGNAVKHALGVKNLDWGLQPYHHAFPDTQIWVLPSTSSANGRFNNLLHNWVKLAESMH